MDSSNSNVNEVVYDDSLNNREPMVNYGDDHSFKYHGESLKYDPPEVKSYYQDSTPNKHSRYPSFQHPTFDPYTFHRYHVTNDHRGQYVMQKQDVNSNLISNER